jgi:peptidoglycan hydrolase-like protein with peptidoglycan-binding domain
MTTPEERRRMSAAIVDFEARRDAKGCLKVYYLKPDDGGGKYEVAGINERYHKETADTLAALIEQKRFKEADDLAQDYVGQYTDCVTSWTSVPAIEFYLRDSVFNRGPSGGARIAQRAVGVGVDGVVGGETRAAISAAEENAEALLRKLRVSREQYERDVAHRDEKSRYWKGLVNRWNKALDTARSFPTTASAYSPLAEMPVASTPAVSTIEHPDYGPIVLPALRVGMRGDRVLSWQSFLQGQGFDPGPIDAIFGRRTRKATIAFQQKFGLLEDGIAGRQTLLKAASLGLELIEEPADDITGSDFPPRPGFRSLVTTAQREALFGHFDYVPTPTRDDPQHVRILGTWQAENIVDVPIPQLRQTLGSKAPATMQFHRLAAKQLQGVWKAWEAAKLIDRIISYDGAFNPRFARGSNSILSNHAFGSAFDINAKYNACGARPALVGAKGSIRELVPIANKWGFFWGGHYQRRLDGMHFEIAVLTQSNSDV